ncbi:MAG: hypothetical protein ACOYMN_05240 [Roseimicrobium sp.]
MKSLLTGVANKPVKSWPGLFDLYENQDGTFRAELGASLAQRSTQLQWKLNHHEDKLARALCALACGFAEFESPDIPDPKTFVPFGGSNVREVHAAARRVRAVAHIQSIVVLKPMHFAIGEGIKELTVAPPAARPEIKKTLMKRFENALDAIDKKDTRHAHKNTATLSFYNQDGQPRQMPLAWAAIEYARLLVERTHELPNKKQIKDAIKNDFPLCRIKGAEQSINQVSKETWTQCWKEAGLAELPQTHERDHRAKPRRKPSGPRKRASK